MEMKEKLRGAATYFRMSTDQRQVPDVTGSGAIMAKVGGNGVFRGKTVEKDMEMKKKKMWDALIYIRMFTDQLQVPDVIGNGAKMAP